MAHLTLLHRDLSSRIVSLKQVVEGCLLQVSQTSTNAKCSIDLNPNTNQLTISTVRKRRKPPIPISRNGKPEEFKVTSTSNQLDEGFESDVDTISLVSTESAISLLAKSQETDSANGSASSDSDDSDKPERLQDDFNSIKDSQCNFQKGQTCPSKENIENKGKNQEKEEEETVTEHVNLVNCVCYKDEEHQDILILIANEETLILLFENSRQLDTFHENFSTVKAVSSQRTFPQRHFNLLQRTDSDGMTHIRISRQESEEFNSLLSLPSIQKPPVSIDKQFATLGKPQRRRQILKKSKSIEDLLDSEEKPLRKVWNSVENLLNDNRPKAPPRRKKGPAPLPPSLTLNRCLPNTNRNQTLLHKPSEQSGQTLNKSYSIPNVPNALLDGPSIGNIFQGQFVRVQVDQPRSLTQFPVMSLPYKSKFHTGPEILKYESSALKNHNKVRSFEAFKFSDPKNLTGYQDREIKQQRSEKSGNRGFSSLMLYIPKYKSKKIQNGIPGGAPIQNSGTFTNRLFGMSSKLKEFNSIQSQCNPNKRYDSNSKACQGFLSGNYNQSANQNPYGCPNVVQETAGRFSLGKFGRLGRSGSLGNLTVLAQAEKGHDSSTLKSVIKKKTREDDERGRKTARGGNGKKVTFSAYNTVQVV